nr:hypothetical protein [Evansella caseinilytica]
MFLAILLATLLTSNASAADNESEQEEQALVELGSEVIDRADYGSEDEFEQALNQLINDPDVLGVTAIDSRDSVEPVLIQPNKLLPYIKNVKHQGDYIQNVTLATVWADPGIETSLTNSWKRSATFSSNNSLGRSRN